MSYIGKIDNYVIRNNDYNKAVYTDPNIQIVLIDLKPNEFIDWEKHKESSQIFRCVTGQVNISTKNKSHVLKEGEMIIIPPKTFHHVQNGPEESKLYTVYSPPIHDKNYIKKYNN